MKPLSATRHSPGSYVVEVEDLEISLARTGSGWSVWDRSAVWDRDGFSLKRDAMAYLEEVRRGLIEDRAWQRRLHQRELDASDYLYVWVTGLDGSAAFKGEVLRTAWADDAHPAWIGSDSEAVADLIYWRGSPEDLDRQALRALGAQVIAEGSSVQALP